MGREGCPESIHHCAVENYTILKKAIGYEISLFKLVSREFLHSC